MVQQINEQMIREAAYFLWEKAGRPDGSAEFFWMKACEQFFKPTKVAIKKPAKKVEKKVAPVKKESPKKVSAVKPAVKPVVAKAVKTMRKITAKPAAKQAKKTSAPVFYGTRK